MNIHIVYSNSGLNYYTINNTLYIPTLTGWIIYPGGKE